jgi:hypothetical protein
VTPSTERKLVRNAVEWLLKQEDTLSGRVIQEHWGELPSGFTLADRMTPQTYSEVGLGSDIVVEGNILHLCAIVGLHSTGDFAPWRMLVDRIARRIERESPFYKGMVIGFQGSKVDTRNMSTLDTSLILAGERIGKHATRWEEERKKMERTGSTP